MKKLIARTLTLIMLALNLVALSATAHAQGNIELRGTLIDETRAFIAAAPVVLDDGKGHKYTTQTDEQGRYRFTAIYPGIYTITVEVEGFAPFSEQIDLTARRTAPFDITLAVFIKDEIQVNDDQAAISSEPDKNLSAITLTDKDLEALPDDPDELLDTLKQMAGAAGGADEAAIYVGGFRERGRIPPKEAIQMVRINANPFAAEFSGAGPCPHRDHHKARLRHFSRRVQAQLQRRISQRPERFCDIQSAAADAQLRREFQRAADPQPLGLLHEFRPARAGRKRSDQRHDALARQLRGGSVHHDIARPDSRL